MNCEVDPWVLGLLDAPEGAWPRGEMEAWASHAWSVRGCTNQSVDGLGPVVGVACEVIRDVPHWYVERDPLAFGDHRYGTRCLVRGPAGQPRGAHEANMTGRWFEVSAPYWGRDASGAVSIQMETTVVMIA